MAKKKKTISNHFVWNIRNHSKHYRALETVCPCVLSTLLLKFTAVYEPRAWGVTDTTNYAPRATNWVTNVAGGGCHIWPPRDEVWVFGGCVQFVVN